MSGQAAAQAQEDVKFQIPEAYASREAAMEPFLAEGRVVREGGYGGRQAVEADIKPANEGFPTGLAGSYSNEATIASQYRDTVGQTFDGNVKDRQRIERAIAAARTALGSLITKGVGAVVRGVAECSDGKATDTEKEVRNIRRIIANPGTKAFTQLAIGLACNHIGYHVPQDAAFETAYQYLAQQGSNISVFSSVGKGGAMYKTIRIPKAVLRLPTAEGSRSGVMILLQIINTVWSYMFPGIRPQGLFAKAFLTYLKSLVGVSAYVSLSGSDVVNVLKALKTNYPKVLALYFLKKNAREQYNAAAAAAQRQHRAELAVITENMQRAMNQPTGAIDAVMASLNFIAANDQIDPSTASDAAIAGAAARFDSASTIRKPVSKTKYWASNTASDQTGLGSVLSSKLADVGVFKPEEVSREAFRAEAKPYREAIRAPLTAQRRMARQYQLAMETIRNPNVSAEQKNKAMAEARAYASAKANEMAIRDSNRAAQITGTPYDATRLKAAQEAYYNEYMAPAATLLRANLPPTYYAEQQAVADRLGQTWGSY